MIELLLIAQLTTSQPPEQQQQSYKPTEYKQEAPKSSVPTSKQIEEFEERIFDHPNG